MNENAVLNVITNAARESKTLTVAPEANQVFRIVIVFDARDLLLDNGAGIEIFCGIVAGGADEFYAPFEGALIRVCSDKGWEKGVVDIDDAGRIFLAKPSWKNLHEAGENDQLCASLV
jgi:hypothetical protein